MKHQVCWLTCSSVTSSVYDEGIVLMDLATGRLFAANRVGAAIWQALQGAQTSETIAANLSRDHGISFDRAEASTARFIAQLAAHALVRPGAAQ
jgi:hypothetical protein